MHAHCCNLVYTIYEDIYHFTTNLSVSPRSYVTSLCFGGF